MAWPVRGGFPHVPLDVAEEALDVAVRARQRRAAQQAVYLHDPVGYLQDRLDWDPDPWQAEAIQAPDARQLWLVTRQGGKSTTVAAMTLHTALFEPGTLQLMLSPGLRQSSELFRKCKDFYHRHGTLEHTSETALTLTLQNGSRVVSLPGNENTVRGYSSVRRLIIDEAARVPETLYLSVRPMLAVSHGDLIALSTPWGKRGWFYEAWKAAKEGKQNWRVFEIPATMCPRITPEFLAEERNGPMGERWFKQEYFCSFEDTVQQLIATDLLDLAFSTDDYLPLFSDELEQAAMLGTAANGHVLTPLFEVG